MNAVRADSVGPLLPSAPAIAPAAIYDLTHVVLPLAIGIALVYWLEVLAGNRVIADWIFARGGGQWLLKEHLVTGVLIHPGGKYLSLMMWFATLWLWWQSRQLPALLPMRRSFAFLLLSTVVAISLVSLLKSTVPMDCPWDMQGYGGVDPYVGLFDARPAGVRLGRCFPAGHASSGYAWVALYFFFRGVAPRWRLAGLMVGLSMGLMFGISQQLRGAHFLSHDVVALLVCWLTALVLHRWMGLSQLEPQR